MSLNRRIILSATLVLVTFITLTALALERAFSESAEGALHDKMTTQLYALMAAAEVDGRHLVMPTDELDALLGLPSSGIYAFVTAEDGAILWQSSSVLGAVPPQPTVLDRGDMRAGKVVGGSASYYMLAHGVHWAPGALALTFNLFTDLASLDGQVDRYRATLWGWLSAMALLLLVSQAFILRWGLLPLRRVGDELNLIENGEKEAIEGTYPREIRRLTGNINVLLQHEREHKTRYRDALADLAHSLKTPLAVMQSTLFERDEKNAAVLREQIGRMNTLVEYQLQRAAMAGPIGIGRHVDVRATVARLADSLFKVYADRAIELEIAIAAGTRFEGDEGDLMEILGNLLDNAFKWCRRRVRVTAERRDARLHLRIEDDGPGLPPGEVERLLQRGARADTEVPGHGIGLSIVRNIVTAYRGSLDLGTSELGGLCVRIVI